MGPTVSQLSDSAEIELVDRVDVTPPSIVGSRLVGLAGGSGIELTFSEPMDPASVENPANYAVSENSHRPNALDSTTAAFLLSGSGVRRTTRPRSRSPRPPTTPRPGRSR